MNSLYQLLQGQKADPKRRRDQGTLFEEVCLAWLRHDVIGRFKRVRTFAEWAADEGRSGQDMGIDLVADMADGSGWCAVQCKFHAPERTIARAEINKFLAESSKKGFVERMLIETGAGLNRAAEDALRDQDPPVQHVGLDALEESTIEWAKFIRTRHVSYRQKMSPKPHQLQAVRDVLAGLKAADRGKMIMACGTGKTFTSLLVAERMAGKGGRTLLMVPSLALMSQTISAWTNESEVPIRAFAVCSDTQVGKVRGDAIQLERHELAFPATTDARALARQAGAERPERMTVVFATYHSVKVLVDAQRKHGLPAFDLIVCDEAHRTTGVTLEGEEPSAFTRVHDEVQGKKRLYMTATPRVYGAGAAKVAQEKGAELVSMDDEQVYGKNLHVLDFADAVDKKLLSDYRVIVLGVDEAIVSQGMQRSMREGKELTLDQGIRIVGCLRALAKAGVQDSRGEGPMRRAVAFCSSIAGSKSICEDFGKVREDHERWWERAGERALKLDCEARHVDGTFRARARTELLDWLRADPEPGTCKILSNARCLSEGVDVPALDAVMFLHPRKSQMDVVQAVGRVMRRHEGKEMGYVIIPVGVPTGTSPEEALDDNARYQAVWQILNALRSHDERLDGVINQAGLDGALDPRITIVVDTLAERREPAPVPGISEGTGGRDDPDSGEGRIPLPRVQLDIDFQDRFTKAVIARMVRRCGTRVYWENWAGDVGRIAQNHITRIAGIVRADEAKGKVFQDFLAELRDDLNPAVTEAEAIEMLGQHLVTRPVFEAMFSEHDFMGRNRVSVAMSGVLGVLDEAGLGPESERLAKFFDSVRARAAGVETDAGRQTLVTELYDKFFRTAFPRLSERLGIVYTPVEVVDFIIHSVNDVLSEEFGQTLGSRGVHILDPFTGTGTFIARLIQSGLISPEELPFKYRSEIHANEIVLLAYYIASINIESAYMEAAKGGHAPFEGICLTDTFQLHEQDRDMVARLLPDNSGRRTRQRKLDIRVIMGNPPYSVGQRSANDNAQNVAYPMLDRRIADTYARHSSATSKKALYDSYVRAIRWGGERLGEAGVMAYVTNAGWVDGHSMAGLRKCLAEECSSLYVFHLRGNARTSGESRRAEGGNVFGAGSRAPVAITLFVKNPAAKERGQIHFHDIGDHLDRAEKLKIVRDFKSVRGIAERGLWRRVRPDQRHDWLDQRDAGFERYLPLGDKKGKGAALFGNYSLGLATARDAWCCNASKEEVERNVRRMIEHYNQELERYLKGGAGKPVDQFIDRDKRKIAWTSALKSDFANGKPLAFNEDRIVPGLYRPFTKQWTYFDRRLNERVYQMPQIFPYSGAENRLICVTGIGASAGSFSVIMVDVLPDLNMLEAGAQCFPLRLYPATPAKNATPSLLKERSLADVQDGITAAGLAHFQAAYPQERIDREEVFYYVYGLLHSPEYRERFRNNLAKQLPRIPAVKRAEDFRAFAAAGRELGELHVGYEHVKPHEPEIPDSKPAELPDADRCRVTQMKFAGKRGGKDKGSIIYNGHLTLHGVPAEAYAYVVDGKSAVEWVMDRQGVRPHKDSGIENDANRYAVETAGDPAYPLKLLQRVITVSLETAEIVRKLPKLEFERET